jgi:hypothetical protein
MEPTKVVVRYADGRIAKGFIQNFSPNKDSFHITPIDQSSGKTIEVFVKRLKAIFWVRDFSGNAQYNERRKFLKEQTSSGLKVEVIFVDGETMVGSTVVAYDPKRQGNFLIPADPASNNIRVFIVSSAVRSVRQLFDDPE